MATPCRKCGATKTESVYHGTAYSLARRFGYRLRVCSRCRRYRLLDLDEHPDAPVMRDAPPKLAPDPPPVPSEPPGTRRSECPRCGSTDHYRSRRRWYERLFRRSAMARCRRCQKRFPLSSA